MRYWVDADVFIGANNLHYPIKHAQGFWKWMDSVITKSILVSPKRVFDEVTFNRKKDDDLYIWVHRHKKNGLCIMPTPAVYDLVRKIGDYVYSNPQYPNHQRLAFSKGADAWLIVAAMEKGDTVVSNESDKFPNSERVRIPDVCHHFSVRCLTMNQLIRELDAHF